MADGARWEQHEEYKSDAAEQQVLFAALDSFYQYRRIAHLNVTHRRRQNFYALPTADWELLAAAPLSILSHLDAVDDAIDKNAEIATAILEAGLQGFGFPSLQEADKTMMPWRGAATPLDLDKARTTIHQFYRDWSSEGQVERAVCYEPILKDLESLFAHVSPKSNVSVLVPGAGLGRLVFDICNAGYSTEGNEISFHALIASDFVLNHTSSKDQFQLYPFIMTFSNHLSRKDQMASVTMPDIHPGTALEESSSSAEVRVHAFDRLGMAAADFTDAYAKPDRKEHFDAVATAFFIDTSSNILTYIRTVHNCLRDGGYWINNGPLLWHFEDRVKKAEDGDKNASAGRAMGIDPAGSVELTNEEVLLLLEQCGFKLVRSETSTAPAGYIQNPRSMIQNTYRLSHWVAQKV